MAFCLDLHVCFSIVFKYITNFVTLFFWLLNILKEASRNSKTENVFCVSDTYGLFNFLIPGTSFYSAIESSSLLVSTSSGTGFVDKIILPSSFSIEFMPYIIFWTVPISHMFTI